MPGLVAKAKADLAGRLAIPVEAIVVVEAASVTWPDASLGCPQEGMRYAQVLTRGYLIRLRAGERDFEYHAGRGTTLVTCENPSPPFTGAPPDV